ncbi:MAG: gamma-glutamyl-gamma-aminobutyrate hydrolase family protein [Firmicutes bacterium]|nr:gamma-glutamyl-gamma-aminobutyrate hydrolase family protein [Bacillota bacterium]
MHTGDAPLVGITTDFDSGRDSESLRPRVSLSFIDTAYSRALERAGAVPVLLPPTGGEASAQQYVRMLDGLVLSGGGHMRRRHLGRPNLPDLKTLAPRRFRFEAALLRAALAEDAPVLGICRGHQMIVRIGGGRCFSRIDRRVPGARDHFCDAPPVGRRVVHEIRIAPGTLLHRILGQTTIGVNSLHRQAAERVAPPFVISARADDGIPEAVESRTHRFVVGVQFHPELLMDAVPEWRRLFDAFVEACRTSRARRRRLAPVISGAPV